MNIAISCAFSLTTLSLAWGLTYILYQKLKAQAKEVARTPGPDVDLIERLMKRIESNEMHWENVYTKIRNTLARLDTHARRTKEREAEVVPNDQHDYEIAPGELEKESPAQDLSRDELWRIARKQNLV